MVIDSSAIVAVLLNEKNAAQIAQAIEAASQRLFSAANLLEASIVIESRKGEAGGQELDLLLYRAAIEIVPSIKTRPKPPASPGGVLAEAGIPPG